MISPSLVDERGMLLSSANAGTTATDGSWMDLTTAAAYAGVPFSELARAINRGDLDPDMTGGRAPTLVLHSHAIEAWAAAREWSLRQSLAS
ncbi:MAG: hypothetical protein ACXV2H_02930 [Actinomycetes bacterium]